MQLQALWHFQDFRLKSAPPQTLPKGAVITRDHLPELESPLPKPAAEATLDHYRGAGERFRIQKALQKAQGRREAAARLLATEIVADHQIAWLSRQPAEETTASSFSARTFLRTVMAGPSPTPLETISCCQFSAAIFPICQKHG